MEEEKTRREVQVKHALRAERDSRDDRKRNRDATSVYTHIYIYITARTASIFGRSLDYHPITIPILKQASEKRLPEWKFPQFRFRSPQSSSSIIKNPLFTLFTLHRTERERDFCHGGAEISREGEEVREEEEKEWREREKEGRDPQSIYETRASHWIYLDPISHPS